jgi:phosphate:Na+ symporter
MVPLSVLFSIYIIIFLLGMLLMKSGLYSLSGHKLKKWLLRFTKTPFQGFVTGTLITALLQSSSAVMVMTIGLVTTRYLTFRQSLGIILGTNIGSTITTEIITLDISKGIIPMLFFGAAIVSFARSRLSYSLGTILVGLSCIFFAMDGFSQLVDHVASHETINKWLIETNKSTLLGLALGIVVTAIIHSSAATIGIAMSFLNEHILTLPAGIAILLGANIGTCVTGLLASIGSSYESKLTAYTHLWFNIIGVIIFFPFIHLLSLLVQQLTAAPDLQLAHASVLFNVICSIAALPFTHWIEAFIIFMHGKKG